MMRKIVQINNKRAISELLAYVLLVGLAVSLSIAIYSWLKFYVNPSSAVTCPGGVSLIIYNYNCSTISGKMYFNLEVQNKGLFNISGYILRVNDKNEGLPVYLITNTNFTNPLMPHERNYSKLDIIFPTIKEVEIEPFRIDKDKQVLCDQATIRQKITGC